MATATSLMTAEQYLALPDSFDGPTELVKGELVTMPPSRPRRGEICVKISYLLCRYLDDHPMGRVVGNDAGVITERDPDSVRGPDVAYYSYNRVPRGPLPNGLLPIAPELAFEVRSPNDRWSKLHVKVSEYLEAGVMAVCVVDDETKSVHLFHADHPTQVLKADDVFALPHILGDFHVKVARFFE
jgi:Uma2 family endonuclease